MNTNQYKFQCDYNTSLNTIDDNEVCQRRRGQIPRSTVPQKTCCPPVVKQTCCIRPCGKTDCSAPKKVFTCCTEKAPNICVDPCEKLKCSNKCYDNFCTIVKNEFVSANQSIYGNKYTSKMGKVINNCECIKFNGLQDTCKHPDCCSKIGCLDNPYPTCPPAQKWKCDYMCRKPNKPCIE